MNYPKVGIGVLIFNEQNILLGKRIASHGVGTWSPPGGHLEFGESFEECALREVQEETGLTLTHPEFLAVTNDVFADENKHYVTIFMVAQAPEDQVVKNMEPEKTASWEWINIHKLPARLFMPLQTLIKDDGMEMLMELIGGEG